ncbi:hypothetical protein GOB40_32520 [Sinorhizobium meliloti]|nr:hypothetical protein [Sinorhizobium meliloti]MDW9621897.1 hypothetical protein [Sinorhizobium meliloti]MDX0011341.1 hypothetical protein [Sinorhizobium meliloti]MDX0160140.1 hypothetical protein [Sinorhizobium meliloti]MDX0179227.1 hypothetical protein [Sinorhizobium meliloti]
MFGPSRPTHECATACGPRWVAGHESTVAQIEFGLPAMFRPPIRRWRCCRWWHPEAGTPYVQYRLVVE